MPAKLLRISTLSGCILFLFSCGQIELGLSPKTEKQVIAKLTVKGLASKKDCLGISHIVYKYYTTSGEPFCGEKSIWDFGLTYTTYIKVPVVHSDNECNKPICLEKDKNNNFYLVINRQLYQKLQNDIKEYGEFWTNISDVKLIINPKGQKILAYDVYVDKVPYILYEGPGNIKLTYDKFIFKFLEYHGWAPLIIWK